jgi:hypothetical protein
MKQFVQQSSLTDKLLLIGLGIAGFWYFGAKVKESNKNTSQNQIDNSPEANQADSLYRLLHPYGGGLLSVVENVDEKAVINWAKQITNPDKVNEYYRQMTGGKSLWDEVSFALTHEEYVQFKKNLNLKSDPTVNPVKTVIAAPTGTQTKTTAFLDPYFQNVVESFAPGATMGTTLKSVKYFSKQYNKDMLLYYIKLTTGKNKGKSVYVLQSQVKLK